MKLTEEQKERLEMFLNERLEICKAENSTTSDIAYLDAALRVITIVGIGIVYKDGKIELF